MGKSKQQRKKEKKVVLMFDETERRDFLSGFSKRKQERQRKAKEKSLTKLEAQRKKLLDEKRLIMADIVREGGIKLQDPQNLESLTKESETIDCGDHMVTITELDDAYGAVQEAPGLPEIGDEDSDNDPDEPLFAGASAGDQRKIRLKQIGQELKDFSVQMQPIKLALNDKAKKQKKRQQKMQERKEQEQLRKKNAQKSGGIKRRKVNKHIIAD